jgi:hypothetical protein
MEYDDNGRLTAETELYSHYPNKSLPDTEYVYDVLGNLTEIHYYIVYRYCTIDQNGEEVWTEQRQEASWDEYIYQYITPAV